MGSCLINTCETLWGELQKYDNSFASGEDFPKLLTNLVQLHISPLHHFCLAIGIGLLVVEWQGLPASLTWG